MTLDVLERLLLVTGFVAERRSTYRPVHFDACAALSVRGEEAVLHFPLLHQGRRSDEPAYGEPGAGQLLDLGAAPDGVIYAEGAAVLGERARDCKGEHEGSVAAARAADAHTTASRPTPESSRSLHAG